ncbi:MAG: hypothetical protein IJ667_12350 [Synergistaceae bacterium]|nr:hypothetical protein [Synergistaceae bacterium]
MKKQQYMDSLLRNAERILHAAGLHDEEFAVAMNRVYKHYSGVDIFKVCGIVIEDKYYKTAKLKVLRDDPQLTLDEAIAKAGDNND